MMALVSHLYQERGERVLVHDAVLVAEACLGGWGVARGRHAHFHGQAEAMVSGQPRGWVGGMKRVS